MKTKFVIISFLMVFLFSSFIASAGMIDIDEISGTYYPGDSVNLSVSITNEYNETKSFLVETFVIYPRTPPKPSLKSFEIVSGKTIFFNENFIVHETIDSGEYFYQVMVFDNETEAERKNVSFRVSGTLDTFDDIYARTCSDLECDGVQTVFLVGEKAYLEVFNSEDAELAGDVIYPTGHNNGLSFTGGFAMIDIDPPGDYIVNITASKDGYKTKSWLNMFSVMNEEPEFINDNVCAPDGKCSGEENHQNCPQDCLPAEGKEYYYIIGIIVLIIVAASAFVIKKFR
ncbi:MAG: hypothetical protein JW754_05320 [Candidatus Aenigmarchaeota archaeon]|nr:hypothetical protein [Candidatus Aenigmarchaeota archaeon]